MAGGLHLGKKATVAQAEGTESHLINKAGGSSPTTNSSASFEQKYS